jgi:hypothetical protein
MDHGCTPSPLPVSQKEMYISSSCLSEREMYKVKKGSKGKLFLTKACDPGERDSHVDQVDFSSPQSIMMMDNHG